MLIPRNSGEVIGRKSSQYENLVQILLENSLKSALQIPMLFDT